jgi:hypothetical protein
MANPLSAQVKFVVVVWRHYGGKKRCPDGETVTNVGEGVKKGVIMSWTAKRLHRMDELQDKFLAMGHTSVVTCCQGIIML